MRAITEHVLSASEAEQSSNQTAASSGRFSVFSISLFLFQLTFWIAIALVLSGPLHSVAIVAGSMLTLLAGVIFGLIAIVRGPSHDGGRSVMGGMVGVGVNGLLLLAIPLCIAAGKLAAPAEIHPEPTLAQAPPAVAATQPVAVQTITNNTTTIVQTNIIDVTVQVTPRAHRTKVYANYGIFPPSSPIIVRTPYFLPQSTMRPIFVPRPVFVPMSIPMRRY